MRLKDLCYEYGTELKENKGEIMWSEMPLVKKIVFIIYATISLIGLIISMNNSQRGVCILFVTLFGLIVFNRIWESKIKNRKRVLEKEMKPDSENRMKMLIGLLKKYNIEYTDKKIIELLILRAEEEREQYDYLKPLYLPVKGLGQIVVPIVVLMANKIYEVKTLEEFLTIAFLAILGICIVYGMMMAFIPFIKELLYVKYHLYSELIYDLKQVELFYK